VIVNCASLLFFKEVVVRHYNKGILDGDQHRRPEKENLVPSMHDAVKQFLLHVNPAMCR